MAVQFLTGLNVNGNININTNQLQNVVIQPLAADPAGIDGRIYYNSGTNKLKIYNGTDWVAFQTGTDGDTTYDLTGVGSTNGTAGVRLTGSDASVDDVLVVGAGTTTVTRSGNTLTVTSNDSAVGTVTSVATTHGGNAFTASIGNVATVNPSVDVVMAGDATQYVNGAGNLVLLSTIPQGDITEVQGGTYINVTNQTGPIPIVNHDTTSRSNTTSAVSPAAGATFTAVDSVTSNATGHVTGLNLKTVTLPPDNNDNTTYTLPVSAGGSNSAVLSLTGSVGGVSSTVTISGTAGEIKITETAQNNGTVFIGLPDDVTIPNDLTVTNNLTVLGTGAFTGQVTIPLVPGADEDAASKRYVDQSNIGQSVFQGGYNADTNTPDLDVSPATDIKKGFFWAVTVTGDFFTETVQPGDLIYADQDNPGATFGNWVVVQSGQDIATAGAQASAIRGISAYDSTNFSVDASGWVTLNPQGNANGRRVDLTSTLGYVTRVETGTSPDIVTTFTVDIRNTVLFGTAADASRVKVETTDRQAPFATVYPDVSRSGSGTVIVAMNDIVADNTYSILLNYV
tara:strand:+ start:107 stop:1807 length:1701 start_codon:yes stop_codon:yes gene_type:complete